MVYQIRPQGVCSQLMTVEVVDGVVLRMEVMGGCDGNLQGISQLVKGRPAEEVVRLLKGIRCGYKDTSCPDQLAQGLEKILAQGN